MKVGHYELHDVIGRGGMAEVYRARRLDGGDDVAMKIIIAPQARSSRTRRYFDSEVAAVARLAHPGVVQIVDLGVVDESEAMPLSIAGGSPYLAMELVDGPTLADDDLHLGWVEIRAILDGILRALAHAHARGVLHLDIKPANVLLRAAGRGYEPVLTDFGIAQALDTPESPDSTRVVGTPTHMAPEQVLGHWRDYRPATDLYATGSIGWWLATGAAPFASDRTYDLLREKTTREPAELQPTLILPDGFEPWVRKMLAREPQERFASAAEARHALARVEDPTRSYVVPADWRGGDAELPYDPSPAIVGLRVPPFVGRPAERDILWTALLESRHRGTRFVVVEGETGMGKTRTAEWLTQRAEELGIATILSATHGSVRTPLDGISGMLARHFRTTSLDRDATAERIATILGHHRAGDDTLAVDAVSLAEIALPPGPRETSRVLTTTETSRVVGRFVHRLTEIRPVILLLDDLHWGLDALTLVQSLLDLHPDAPVLVLATYRTTDQPPLSEALGALAQHPALRTVSIGPLDPSSVDALIRQILPADQHLIDRLAGECGGSPAVVIETIADLTDRGQLLRTPAGWTLREDTQPTRNTLTNLWRRRAEFAIGSDADAWRALEVAAILGLKFDGVQWREVCTNLDIPLTNELAERLVRYRIVRLDVPEDREVDAYSFAHDVLRQSIVQRAEGGRRRERMEAACARVLERHFGRSSNPDVLRRIAAHYEAAGEADRAATFFRRAARHHRERGEGELAYRSLRSAERLAATGDEATTIVRDDETTPGTSRTHDEDPESLR